MKAAHRKELEKNVLADRLGHLAQNIRKPPQRKTVYIIIGVVVLLAIFLAIRRVQVMSQYAAAERWVEFDDGYRDYIHSLMEKHGDQPVGKAARFQYTWMLTWDMGIKRLAADPPTALSNLDKAEQHYRALVDQCKDDPVWEAEAMYGMAVIEESRAVKDRKHLDAARDLFSKVANKHPQSVHGKLARERADKLKAKSESREEIAQFYQDLELSLPQLRMPKLPFGHPPIK